MTPNLLVLNGNPKPDSLCHALAREYARSAEQRGARVTLHHVGELAFAPDLHHGYDEAQPLEPDLQAVQQSLMEAHHLVIVAPVWWGHLPARLKGLLDRTLLPGFAFRYQPGKAYPEQLLAGKTARLLLTMDSPPWYYRWWQGAPLDRTLDKPVLGLCGGWAGVPPNPCHGHVLPIKKPRSCGAFVVEAGAILPRWRLPWGSGTPARLLRSDPAWPWRGPCPAG
ncbi:NAD(P)H-dependent oxidoreductase [Aeromonas caviae]|uniref:NAD(P)H-dependent oxidoreductase n=1 Tax=Aeromonas caviae TaxID=648 RepID=UPI00214E8F82|nr:NAD(P)H-dependent oxidoreductase [Aeromonas caviae]MCR3985747.1 NAD(P)H-dependent oxidoreductase [Aeromonas caviae]